MAEGGVLLFGGDGVGLAFVGLECSDAVMLAGVAAARTVGMDGSGGSSLNYISEETALFA